MKNPTNLREVIELLYAINSQLVSLRWIGMKQKPTDEEIDLLNESLAQCIKVLRNIDENTN